MRGKKASLEISVYAIVIVIIAIIVISLSLVLIRTIFKNLGTKVQEAVSAQEIVNPPTLDIPMTATPPTIELRKGEIKKSSLAFMNVLPDYAYCKLSHRVSGSLTPPDVLYSSDCTRMSEEQINVWTVIASPQDITPTGTTIFTMMMSCYATSGCTGTVEVTFTRDIVVTVKD